MFKKLGTFSLLFFLLIFGFIVSCGTNDNETDAISGVYTYGGTTSPGDVWEFVINHDDNTFIGYYKESGKEYTISGTFELLPSGFYKATITDIENPSGNTHTPSIGDQAYFVELPGVFLAVHPDGEGSHTMVFVNKGSCEDISGDYNYLRVAFYNSDDRDEYGYATFSGGSSITLNVSKKKISDPSYSQSFSFNGSCSDGFISINTDDGEVVRGFGYGGGVVVDFGEDNGGAVGFKKSDLSLEDIGNGTYIGVVYSLEDQDGDNSYDDGEDETPVKVELSNGEGNGYPFKDVDTGEIDTSKSVQIKITSMDSGMFDGTLTDNEGAFPLKGIAYKSDDRIIMVVLVYRSDGPEVAVLASSAE